MTIFDWLILWLITLLTNKLNVVQRNLPKRLIWICPLSSNHLISTNKKPRTSIGEHAATPQPHQSYQIFTSDSTNAATPQPHIYLFPLKFSNQIKCKNPHQHQKKPISMQEPTLSPIQKSNSQIKKKNIFDLLTFPISICSVSTRR
jgi:hypothetical protein